MTAPAYNPATDTLVYVADASDPNFTDITTMGAAPMGTAPRIVPHPSPAGPSGGTITATQDLVTGKDGLGKAASMLYPAGDQTKAQDIVFVNPAVPPGLGVTHYIQFAAKFTSDGDGTEQFPVKFFRFLQNGHQGGAAPQWYTHDHSPWVKTSGTYQSTYWMYTNAFSDETNPYPQGHDQGTQPFGPYWQALLNSVANDGYANYVVEHRPHSAALEADGVTKATLTLTGDGTNTYGTAVFSSSMAGKISNGQTISLAPFTAVGGKMFGPYVVSAFDGDKTCTLTPLLGGPRVLASGATAGITYALDFDGCARLYVNGTKIIDVSQSALDAGTPTGGAKQWCGHDILATISVDDPPLSSWPLWFGGDHSGLVPTKNVTMYVNIGDGDATNPDTIAWWTTPYTGSTPTATQLLLSQQPAGAVSGQALTTQPSGTVADSGGSTVTSDTSTVTASWVPLTGDATASGTLTAVCVAGAWAFSTLALTWTVASTGYWTFTDGSLTSVNSNTLTLTVAPPDNPPPPDYGITPGAPAVYRMARGKALFAGFRRMVRAVWRWLTLSASLA